MQAEAAPALVQAEPAPAPAPVRERAPLPEAVPTAAPPEPGQRLPALPAGLGGGLSLNVAGAGLIDGSATGVGRRRTLVSSPWSPRLLRPGICQMPGAAGHMYM